MAPVVTMRDLLEAGVHFGHQTRRWNPKMKRFIHGERNGIYIIDLQQTLSRIEEAYTFVRDLTANGGTVLFVGTKKQAQDSVQSYAEACGMPYINNRWLGGMLTNFQTISKRVGKMREYEQMRASGEFEAMPKKEALMLSRELSKLERNLYGIRNMTRLPDAVFVLDTKNEEIAVTEARKLKLPLIAVVDTNCDPDLAQYIIPGNDDAIRSATLMTKIVSEAVKEGRFIASRKNLGAPAPQPTAPPPAPGAPTRVSASEAPAPEAPAPEAPAPEAPAAASPPAESTPPAADAAPPPAPVSTPAPEVPPTPPSEAAPAPAAGETTTQE